MKSVYVNDSFIPLLTDTNRFLVMFGGAGSSKSYTAAQKVILRCMAEPRHRFIVVRKVKDTIKESTFALLQAVIEDFGVSHLWKVNLSVMSLTYLPNASKIVHFGLDSVDKLKSLFLPSSMWIEEATELDETDLDQLNLRVRGITPHYKQIILTFNPVDEKHWLKRRMFDDKPDNVTIHHSTYKDNLFAGEEYEQVMEELRIKNPRYFQVFALGHWGSIIEGRIFVRDHYHEWTNLPDDCRGVIYVDPNLSLKGLGDTTAIVGLTYSPSADHYFVVRAACRSYSDPRELLEETLEFRRNERLKTIGFDGNVSQESNWTNHIRSYCREKGIAFPVVEYKRYNTEQLTKNAQWIWNEGKVAFPPGFKDTVEGKRFLDQVSAFNGKKHTKGKDDAPDALICAFELIFESGFGKGSQIPTSIQAMFAKM